MVVPDAINQYIKRLKKQTIFTVKLSMGKPYRYLNGKYMYVIRENLDKGKFKVTTV